MRTTTFILWTLMVVLMAACGDESAPGISVPPETAVTTPAGSVPATVPDSTAPPKELPEDDQATIVAAKKDLAGRTGIDAVDIELESFSKVTWNDGALGCPNPGEVYTQALVDGSRTVLIADGTEYHYHAADGREPFLCERPELQHGPGVTVPPDDEK